MNQVDVVWILTVVKTLAETTSCAQCTWSFACTFSLCSCLIYADAYAAHFIDLQKVARLLHAAKICAGEMKERATCVTCNCRSHNF